MSKIQCEVLSTVWVVLLRLCQTRKATFDVMSSGPTTEYLGIFSHYTCLKLVVTKKSYAKNLFFGFRKCLSCMDRPAAQKLHAFSKSRFQTTLMNNYGYGEYFRSFAQNGLRKLRKHDRELFFGSITVA